MKEKSINKLIKDIKKSEFKKVVQPPVKRVEKNYRERDMRQEAMDMGAHNAKEFFGGK